MNKKLILFSIAMMFSLILISNAQAGVGYKEYSTLNSFTNTSRIYGFMQFGSQFEAFPSTLCFYNYCYTAFLDYSDYVPLGQPFQAYIEYGMTPLNEWNSQNPNATIDFCNIRIRETYNTSLSTITLDKTFTIENTTITPNQYKQFVSLQRSDYAEVFFECHYTNSNDTILSPAQFRFTAPTLNCKACQYYNHFKASADEQVADSITDNTNSIKTNIILIVKWNISLWITFFLILTILALVSVSTLFFMGIYWAYLFVKSFGKRK